MSVSNVINNKSTRLFLILAGFFVCNALIAEFIAVKIFSLEGTLGWNKIHLYLFNYEGSLDFPAGVLLWPIVFVMTDIINEYYGKRGIRFLSYLTVGLIAYAFAMIYISISFVPASWWIGQSADKGVPDMQAAFEAILGQGMLIIVGSIIAFLVAQIVDVVSFHRIKKITGENKIWLRATGSTLVSQLVDSFVVTYIAFVLGPQLTNLGGEPWAINQFFAISSVQYIYKFIVAIALTPVIYLGHYLMDNYLGQELAKEMKEKATTWN
ncbi:MAG: queuosine precursor transporter [Saprospiraceae bacterium]|nr:queuosine precursor transporter [Saprospiraceae bacterium]